MANGGAFEHACQLSASHPSLDIGCHIVLVNGPSLSRPGQRLPGSLPELLFALRSGRLDARAEIDAQLNRFAQAGIAPSHIDTHKHTHLLPQVLDPLLVSAKECGIRWVRRPFDVPRGSLSTGVPWLRRRLSGGISLFRRGWHDRLAEADLNATDHFAGFQMTGSLDVKGLLSVVSDLPKGTTEFMTHPGFCRQELMQMRTRLKRSREQELQALCSPVVRESLVRLEIVLTSYRELDREAGRG
jgi:predicted glycoside hydrolase/deacetylase ChbG (UPF0249 family)